MRTAKHCCSHINLAVCYDCLCAYLSQQSNLSAVSPSPQRRPVLVEGSSEDISESSSNTTCSGFI